MKLFTSYNTLCNINSDYASQSIVQMIIKKYFTTEKPAFYVSPVWGKITPAALVDYVKEKELSEVCVQVQLHKIIWSPDKRGV